MINQSDTEFENLESLEIQITDQHTIEEAFHVLKENRNWSESTRNNYAHDTRIFESFLCEQGYDPLLKNVKFHFVTKWIKEQQKDNLSIGTIQRRIAAMSSLFSFYLNLGIVHTNPFKAVEKPEGSSSYDSALMEMDDLKKMFAVVNDLKKQKVDIEVTTKVMFYSGLRNSALSQLKVKDVLFEQALLQKTNDIENSKNKYQFLPIPPKLLLLLQNHIQKNLLKPEDTLLFGLRGDPLHAKQLNRLTNRLNKALDWTEKNRIDSKRINIY
jgi:site-specific recombinase XerD